MIQQPLTLRARQQGVGSVCIRQMVVVICPIELAQIAMQRVGDGEFSRLIHVKIISDIMGVVSGSNQKSFDMIGVSSALAVILIGPYAPPQTIP
jgi:hypothetical protein